MCVKDIDSWMMMINGLSLNQYKIEVALISSRYPWCVPYLGGFYQKLDHRMMQFQGFDWLSDHGMINTMPGKVRPLNCFLVVLAK